MSGTMKLAKLVVLVAIGCLFTTSLSYGQLAARRHELTQEQKNRLSYYEKLQEDLQTKIKEVRHAIGQTGANSSGEKPGLERYEELSKRIALLKEEYASANRMISRAESKQKLLRSKLVRIEKELARTLNEMPKDPVAQALKKLVEIDESSYETMKKRFESGQIPSTELLTAERKLAESRLEFAKHQWEESADARKALAAAGSALEEAVFETEMQVSEKTELAGEIESLSVERGRLEALVLEASVLISSTFDLKKLISMIRAGNPEETQRDILDRLRNLGVKVYETDKKDEKPSVSAKESGM